MNEKFAKNKIKCNSCHNVWEIKEPVEEKKSEPIADITTS